MEAYVPHQSGVFVVLSEGRKHIIPRDKVLEYIPELQDAHDEAFGPGNWGPHIQSPPKD